MASLTLGITSSELSHDLDLNALTERVNMLFEWHTNDDVRKEFIAPYFPIVQSSGMGKSKLLYEPRAKSKKSSNDHNYYCATILCGPIEIDKESSIEKVYSHQIDFDKDYSSSNDDKEDEKVYKKLCNKLQEICQSKKQKIVLLFDEAQNLLDNDGLIFRRIRWWLRMKNQEIDDKQVVAVFTGTSTGLTNYYRDPPNSRFSRNISASDNYYLIGQKLHDPFFAIHSMGCFKNNNEKQDQTGNITEYEESIPLGRPLFATMFETKNKNGQS